MDAHPPAPQHLPVLQPQRMLRPQPLIPDYEVIRQIGAGAYGEVWLAKSLTGAWRAVKVVYREDFKDDQTFRREFEGVQHYEPISRIHPGLVQILHVGQHDGDCPFYYYVMELADDAYTGIDISPVEYTPRTLQSDLRLLESSHPMNWDYCLEVGCQLARALDYLHSKGLIHRDIKPSNVVFVDNHPKLADIGLVSNHDQTGYVGTEGYIPPEGPGTGRADVYALAMVLYEISTGNDRLQFPELPDDLPPGASFATWRTFNNILCRAGSPSPKSSKAITTANELSKSLEKLRGKAVSPIAQITPHPMSPTGKLVLSGLIGALIASGIVLGGVYLINPDFPFPWSRIPHRAVKGGVSDDTEAVEPVVDKENGQLLIVSTPPGASIYSLANGSYIGDTPYGPVSAEAGLSESYSIRKPTFKPVTVTGTVKPRQPLVLEATLTPYYPPRFGEVWHDANQMSYEPDGADHLSATPLLMEDVRRWLARHPEDATHTITEAPIPAYESLSSPPAAMKQADAIAYVLWLKHESSKQSLLGDTDTIIPEADPNYETGDESRQVYRLRVTQLQQVPCSLTSEPTGALVLVNGSIVGTTPLVDVKVPNEPCRIIVHKDGYATFSRLLPSPAEAPKHVTMETTHSVIFDRPWTNPFGMKFVPMAPDLMVGTHEVTCADYALYLQAHPEQAVDRSVSDLNSDENRHLPMRGITKEEAEGFATWLTHLHRALGVIEPEDCYRLPTDVEWSQMAGIPEEVGDTPYQRAIIPDSETSSSTSPYFWGSHWPPSDRTGNYADQAALDGVPSDRVITNYRDGFSTVSPVGSFAPNAQGIYDLDGNVKEWVSDSYDTADSPLSIRDYDVARGGNYQSFRPNQLRMRTRTPFIRGSKDEGVGFRVVLKRKK